MKRKIISLVVFNLVALMLFFGFLGYLASSDKHYDNSTFMGRVVTQIREKTQEYQYQNSLKSSKEKEDEIDKIVATVVSVSIAILSGVTKYRRKNKK